MVGSEGYARLRGGGRLQELIICPQTTVAWAADLIRIDAAVEQVGKLVELGAQSSGADGRLKTGDDR